MRLCGIKKWWYEVNEMLCQNDPVGLVCRILLVGLESIQLMGLGFEETVIHMWKGSPGTDIVQWVTNAPTILAHLKQSSDEAFLICMYISLTLLLAFLLLLGKARQTNGLQQLARVSASVFTSLLVFPLLQLFVSIFSLQVGSIHFVFSLCGLLIVVGSALIISLLHVHNRWASNSAVAKRNGHNEVILVIVKLVAGVVWNLLPKEWGLVVIGVYFGLAVLMLQGGHLYMNA